MISNSVNPQPIIKTTLYKELKKISKPDSWNDRLIVKPNKTTGRDNLIKVGACRYSRKNRLPIDADIINYLEERELLITQSSEYYLAIKLANRVNLNFGDDSERLHALFGRIRKRVVLNPVDHTKLHPDCHISKSSEASDNPTLILKEPAPPKVPAPPKTIAEIKPELSLSSSSSDDIVLGNMDTRPMTRDSIDDGIYDKISSLVPILTTLERYPEDCCQNLCEKLVDDLHVEEIFDLIQILNSKKYYKARQLLNNLLMEKFERLEKKTFEKAWVSELIFESLYFAKTPENIAKWRDITRGNSSFSVLAREITAKYCFNEISNALDSLDEKTLRSKKMKVICDLIEGPKFNPRPDFSGNPNVGLNTYLKLAGFDIVFSQIEKKLSFDSQGNLVKDDPIVMLHQEVSKIFDHSIRNEKEESLTLRSYIGMELLKLCWEITGSKDLSPYAKLREQSSPVDRFVILQKLEILKKRTKIDQNLVTILITKQFIQSLINPKDIEIIRKFLLGDRPFNQMVFSRFAQLCSDDIDAAFSSIKDPSRDLLVILAVGKLLSPVYDHNGSLISNHLRDRYGLLIYGKLSYDILFFEAERRLNLILEEDSVDLKQAYVVFHQELCRHYFDKVLNGQLPEKIELTKASARTFSVFNDLAEKKKKLEPQVQRLIQN